MDATLAGPPTRHRHRRRRVTTRGVLIAVGIAAAVLALAAAVTIDVRLTRQVQDLQGQAASCPAQAAAQASAQAGLSASQAADHASAKAAASRAARARPTTPGPLGVCVAVTNDTTFGMTVVAGVSLAPPVRSGSTVACPAGTFVPVTPSPAPRRRAAANPAGRPVTAGLAVPPTPATSARMAAMPVRDTGPELAVRRQLHRLGVRWKARTGPFVYGRPDIAWRGAKVAVFVDGCFWHQCPEHYRAPKVNAAWWAAKLGRNAARDAEVNATLTGAGWLVVRVWEHEDPAAAAARIADAYRVKSGNHSTNPPGLSFTVPD